MTAAYRMRGVGWFGGCVVIVLGFYLVSLQVADERKKLESVDSRIHSAERDIRALETEFDTRGNLAQLEKWNGDTLALAAPTAQQFLPDEAALAAVDVSRFGAVEGGVVRTAALLVPSYVGAAAPVETADVAPALAQAAKAMPTAERAVVKTAAAPARSAPMLAKLADAARGAAAVAKVRPQAVAMLDKKLLSDETLGSILAKARSESRLR